MLLPSNPDRIFHVLQYHFQIPWSSTTGQEFLRKNNTDRSAGIRYRPNLLIVQVSPMGGNSRNSRVGHDQRQFIRMSIDRIPEAVRVNMRQVDEDSLLIQRLNQPLAQ